MAQKRVAGLVLTGGGARGAYQSGAIQAAVEIAASVGVNQPFPVLCGMSAGSINVAALASYAHNMSVASRRLADVWRNVTSDQVFRVGPLSMASKAMSWVMQLGMGGVVKSREAKALLDTQPLRELLTRSIPVHHIGSNIRSGACQGLAISAINYADGTNHTFFQSHSMIEPWDRVRRTSEYTEFSIEHVMASTAIPILFPPVQIGADYYGDGSLRNHAPLSPAIKLGATKLLVLGARRAVRDGEEEEVQQPSPGRVMSVLFNSIFLDAVDVDLERLTRINQTIDHAGYFHGLKLKDVEVFVIQPSQDISKIAIEEAHTMPRTIRYLVRGLGSKEETGGLTSYLLFEPGYLRRLIDLGYHDVMARKDEMAEFFLH